MNRYESLVLDKMVELRKMSLFYTSAEMAPYNDKILLLLDCIVDFREPPKTVAVEDGFGVMVGKD